MRRARFFLPLALGLCTAQEALSEPVFTGRVSLSGLLYAETDDAQSPSGDKSEIARNRLGTTSMLGYLELRGLLEGKRLWKDRLDLRLDVRVRATGNFDFERKFDMENNEVALKVLDDPGTSLGISARGYLGGPEYDLREAYGLLRINDRYTLQVGRMFVREADMVKVDGVRLLRKFGGHWEGGVLAGGFPNPYSRSVLSDYTPPCGAGVAGDRVMTITEVANADPNRKAPCNTDGPQLSVAAGLTARYDYSTLWGAAGLVGTVFGGPGDGGPVVPLAKPDINSLNNLEPPDDSSQIGRPRIFLSWINSWRPAERIDLFSDLLFDLYGSNGPQLTRLFALGTLRLLKDNSLSLRLGYSHLSSLAIDMFLSRMLYNRRSGGSLSLSGFSLAENNLTVLRTARDEARLTLDYRVWRRLGIYADGRFRYRSLIGGGSVPDLYEDPLYTTQERNFAGDGTIGARDSGTFKDIRAGLSYALLFNFRANNHVVTLDLGRDFFSEKFTVDFQYVFVHTTDIGGGKPGDECDPRAPFNPVCFGWRVGTTHEVGLTLTGNPIAKLYLLLDYRLIAMTTNEQARTDPANPEVIPTVITNVALLRGEYRW